CCSHFATLRSGGTKPESSPPNGPPATAATTGRKSRTLEGRCMQSPGTHRYVKLDACVHVFRLANGRRRPGSWSRDTPRRWRASDDMSGPRILRAARTYQQTLATVEGRSEEHTSE